MRALVTGGAGFIGSNLVDRLVESDADVLVVDDLSTGREANLDGAVAAGAELSVADVSDMASVERQTATFGPDVIFHLAAQADVRKAVADPVHDARVNVLGTVNALECARRNGARFIFAATGGAVYGEGEGRRLPFREDDRVAPETPYGVSKLAGEHYVDMYRRLHGVPAVALRLGNVYGPRQDPHGEAGVVAIFCGCAVEGRPMTVYGDGRQTRDYIYVDDVVAALLAADEGLRSGDLPSPINIGTGVETTVLDLVSGLSAASGNDLEARHAPARLGEVQRVAIDSSRAAEVLGWRAEADLTGALESTLESITATR